MLTSDQIDVLRGLSGQVVDPVVEFLIRDIARRIAAAGQVTSTAAYQIWRAQNLGVSQKKVMAQVRKLLGASQGEMEALLERSAELGHGYDLARFPTAEAVPFAENTGLQQILDATVQMTREDMSNVTQTLGFVTYDGKCEELTRAYEKSCDFAFQKVVTGAQSYTEAIRDACRGLAEKGIRSIDYESGVHRSLEAAVRGSIMGGLGLMQEKISQQNHDDLGCDGWEISAHAASAPDHEPIQGKQYSDAVYTRLNNSLVRRIGTLNCGHSASPIILGVNAPQYSDEELEEFRRANEKGIEYEGKHYTMYEATQRQRSLERSMRSRKRRILVDEATGDKERLQQDQIRLVRTREEYHRFSEAAGLREQWERAEAAGFTWKHGKAATAAAKVSGRPTIASEQSPRPRKKVDYSVDWGVVQNEEYARRFGKLSTSTKANEAVYTRAKWALNNRDGVKTEELYAVDMRTGEEIARITDQHYPQGVKRTERFDKALNAAERGGAEIMLIHNHPGGSPPSVGDLNALVNTPGAQGITVGHDGSLYRYTSPKRNIPRMDFDIAILKYKEYTYSTAHEKALSDLAERYGFIFEKL